MAELKSKIRHRTRATLFAGSRPAWDMTYKGDKLVQIASDQEADCPRSVSPLPHTPASSDYRLLGMQGVWR
jgi:hypothetical protein